MDRAGLTPQPEPSYDVARRLMRVSSEPLGPSPVQAAKKKLEELVLLRRVPEGEYRQLFSLLRSLEGSRIDRCETTDDLIHEVSRFLAVWPEMFPPQELERLCEVL